MGVIVEFGKVYRRAETLRVSKFPEREGRPSIEVIGGTATSDILKTYVSNKPEKPLNTSEMTELSVYIGYGIYPIDVRSTWISYDKVNSSDTVEAYIEGAITDEDPYND